MRLRSSQLVFLVLLACSVQLGEECATQLTAAVAGPVRLAADTQYNSPVLANPRRLDAYLLPISRRELGPAARAAHLAVWTMPTAAFASAAIISHTSLLRD